MNSRIVICDPNPSRAARLSAPLAADGLRVRCEATLPTDAATNAHCDVLLLSSELCSPDQLRQLRSGASVDAQLVVILPSENIEAAGRYVDAGAHDLIMAPYPPAQIVGRVRAASRRAQTEWSDAAVQCASLHIDLKRREVRRKGRLVSFTANEFHVLHLLVERAGCITTMGMLRQALWGDGGGGSIKSLNAYVRSIRLKIEQDADHPVILTTETGIGYRWMCVEPVGPAA